jgi:hypothetical protein
MVVVVVLFGVGLVFGLVVLFGSKFKFKQLAVRLDARFRRETRLCQIVMIISPVEVFSLVSQRDDHHQAKNTMGVALGFVVINSVVGGVAVVVLILFLLQVIRDSQVSRGAYMCSCVVCCSLTDSVAR